MIERRKHRRIITLKNCAAFIVIALSALAALNIASEMRAPKSNVYGRVEPVLRVETKTPDVAVIPEAPASVPMQELTLATDPTPAPLVSQAPPPSNPATEQLSNPSTKIAIVGDSDGVSIVTPKHRLRGGFLPQ